MNEKAMADFLAWHKAFENREDWAWRKHLKDIDAGNDDDIDALMSNKERLAFFQDVVLCKNILEKVIEQE